MKIIAGYIKNYFATVDKPVFLAVSLLSAILIFCNYYFGIDQWISRQNGFIPRFGYRYILSSVAYWLPYLFYRLRRSTSWGADRLFLLLLLLAPAVFSLKMAMTVNLPLSDDSSWNHYWNRVINWPLRLIVLTLLLLAVWKKYYRHESFFGLTIKNFNWKPYAGMLAIMLPLIAVASTQPDFLQVYPKLKSVAADIRPAPDAWFYKLLFELSYGSDFISIELFFRGFLILAFIKWCGKDSILPMACFYCSIHFGKPLGECISSYFGGIVLGAVVYHTRSVVGGLMVHLGIAWLMETGGAIGSTLL